MYLDCICTFCENEIYKEIGEVKNKQKITFKCDYCENTFEANASVVVIPYGVKIK